MARRLIFGCGYLGFRTATNWLNAGDSVAIVTRSNERADELRRLGFEAIVQDVAANWTLNELPRVDTVLYAIGFDRQGEYSMRQVYVDGLGEVLRRIPGQPHLVYVSSTGVYGNLGDDGRPIVVHEESRCAPVREGGRCCLAAEQRLLGSPLRRRLTILRAAGIYGPDRVPNLKAIRAGDTIQSDPASWLNLIHVEDLDRCVRNVADRTLQQTTFNVSDGCPVRRRDYYRYLANRIGAPAPRFEVPAKPLDNGIEQRDQNASKTPTGSISLRSVAPGEPGEGTRRQQLRIGRWIDNSRLLAELDLAFAYPSYREGLASLTS